jgi:RNase H-fold protein (predicted Holliday junction resolvase)
MAVLGIDPGTRKCGYAVVVAIGTPPLEIGIVETPRLAEVVAELAGRHRLDAIALGSGTHAPPVAGLLGGCGLPILTVDERETTLQARARYFADHPPRGWRRLIPRGMLLPPRPIDDYAALLIAERYFGGWDPSPDKPL